MIYFANFSRPNFMDYLVILSLFLELGEEENWFIAFENR